MTIRTMAGVGLSALLLTGTIVAVHGVAPAVASSRSDPKTAKKAADEAAKAQKALTKGKFASAVDHAEAAVALRGEDAGYRALLGAAYLRAGRFASAEQAFGDVLVLQPENGRAALNQALAMIATGKWDAARQQLDRHSGTISPTDRGLALALAGDPVDAVEVLTAATRSPEADAKTRQNLALAMALAGRWQEARTLVGVDMTPADADARIMQWATFAQPRSASDQVASLLGVTPAVDPGQPVAIALNGAVPVSAVAATPVDAFMPGQAEAPTEVAEAQPEPAPVLATAPAPVIFASGGYKTAVVKPVRIRTATAPRTPAKGNWYVQIGAFQNAAVARDGWSRALRRLPALAEHRPAGMNFAAKGANFYRLAIGGFTRADADALCRGYRARGGVCFVRTHAGDQMASWLKPGVQLASR